MEILLSLQASSFLPVGTDTQTMVVEYISIYAVHITTTYLGKLEYE